MRVVYLAAGRRGSPPPPFRTGAAGHFWLSEDRTPEQETRVALSANSTHALLGHGVVDGLNRLSLEGRLGEGREVVIPPATLEAARRIFIEADRTTYGASYEFVAGERCEPDPVEYRVRIDNREYQRTLARLVYLCTMASRNGRAVWLRI